MKLLAIVAHPDDAVLFSGGTLARHAERGDEVGIQYLTRGELGGLWGDSRDDLARTREQEAREGAQILGANPEFSSYCDGSLQPTLEARQHLTEVIRARQPDVLLTHHESDDHPDHEATARLVRGAFYQASLPLAEAEGDPWEPDGLYFFGQPGGGFKPEVFVDITDTIDTKLRALRAHESQLKFLKQHGGLDEGFDDVVELARARARTMGRRGSVRYAEGFEPLNPPAREYLE